MSTATLNAGSASAMATARAAFRRFVWKEIRMLRQLWLAVLVLGAIIQCTLGALSPPSADDAALLFSAALAATTLYAVGAAAMVFSVEHEDETYDFLTCLPATWWPIFAGKVSVLLASAIALGESLIVVGWLLAGNEMPVESKVAVALGLFGVAILEAIAWGTLFSLLIKRPLLAAIVTLIVGGTAVQFAVYLFAPFWGGDLGAAEYTAAAPQRLAIVAVVLALATVVARRWLTVGASAGRTARLRAWTWLRRPASRAASKLRTSEVSARPRGRSMLSRLIWQSWRDAGKLLALPFAIAAVLVLAIASALVLAKPPDEYEAAAWLATSLFVPALYGAMAFSADQRRGSLRFLAEHAARPRYVWLARHIVWLGTLLALSTALWLIVTSLIGCLAQFLTSRDLEEFVEVGREMQLPADTAIVLSYFIDGAGLAWCGMLTAYGLGQFCSLLVRSEILAAFIAVVLSVVVTAWALVLFAWQLSAWVFLLPIAAALMLATWLRAGDWIAGRNTWQSWLKRALPVIVVVAFISVALPRARLAQVRDDATPAVQRLQPIDIEELIALHRQGDTPEARKTAAMYLRAAESLDSPTAVPLAMEASTRPTCRFDFIVGQFPHPPSEHPFYWKLDALLYKLREAEIDPSFDRLLAALRMNAHLRSGQASAVFLHRLGNEALILEQIGTWAASERRTNEDLDAALDQLTTLFREPHSLPTTLVADHLIVRDVLLDKEPSSALSEKQPSPLVHLAWLANQLPWERERALLALDEITRQNIGDAAELMQALSPNYFDTILRKWLRPRYSAHQTATWELAQPAAATSHFARLEYLTRTHVHELYRAYCNNQVDRQATILKIALFMFRRDQGAYPERLSELVPDYLESVPVDPYSRQPFRYEAAGLDLPLRDFANSGFTRIEANTPLFWSVGAGNAQLRQWEHSSYETDNNDPDASALIVHETAYALVGQEEEWFVEPAFVFPLPK
jgi:hypothetical protein